MNKYRRDSYSDDDGLEEDEYDGYEEVEDYERVMEEGRGQGSSSLADDYQPNHQPNTWTTAKRKGPEMDLTQLALGDEEYYDRMVTLMSGKSTGRRIKRVIGKYGLFQTILGFVLVVLSAYADIWFRFLKEFNTASHGSAVLTLMWLVSFPSFINGLLSLLAVYYWAALCTNRELLTTLLRTYFGILCVLFIFTLWLLCALFLTFGKVNWKTNIDLIGVYGWYVVTLICILPYSASLIYYLMDVSFLNDEIKAKGVITEPNSPPGTKDLTGVTISHLCGLLCAIPFLIFFQLADILSAVYRFFMRCLSSGRKTLQAKELDKNRRKKKRGLCYRIIKTLRKRINICCSCLASFGRWNKSAISSISKKKVRPDRPDRDAEVSETKERYDLKQLKQQEEQAVKAEKEAEKERQKREKEEKDKDREIFESEQKKRDQQAGLQNKQRKEQEDAEDLQERKRLEAENIETVRKEKEEKELQVEVEAELKRRKEQRAAEALAKKAAKQEEEKSKEKEQSKSREPIAFHPVLTAPLYKSFWSSLSTSGTFQCKLKTMPGITVITAHLKKQGFHVVFSNTTGTTNVGAGIEIEIGFCNIRSSPQKQEGLFMARFTVSKNVFSATMKSENPSDVPNFVKKFALAKVLKIDTSI